jgi:pilus assembly protein CpaE
VATQRNVLIIGEAAGPPKVASEVLHRFGFVRIDDSPTLNEATPRLRGEHYDLVIAPIDKLSNVEMTLLEREVRREGSMLIGSAPQADADLILTGMRAGVQEFLICPPDPTDFAAALDRLVRRAGTETQRGLVMAVFSGKGGLGTTSVAINLAYAMAVNHPTRRVALADFVVGGGDSRVFLNLKPSYDVGDLVTKMDRIDQDLLMSVLSTTDGGVWVLPASERAEVAEMLDAASSASIINHLRAHFNVVIDCEHHMSERTLAAFDSADRIVLVTQLTIPALSSTKRTLELCERLGYPESKIFVVVNRHHSGDIVALGDAKEVLKRDVFWRIPNDYRAFTDALTRGKPVVEKDSAAALSKSFIQLAAKLGGSSQAPVAESNGADAGGGSRFGRLLRMGRKN